MSRERREAPMIDVELDDDGAARPERSVAPHRASGASPTTRRRRLAPAWRHPVLALGTAVVVTVVAAGALDASAQRRDAAAVARFERVPGVVASLREEPVERWRTTMRLQVVDGLAVGTEVRDDAEVTVVSDARTGREMWTAPRAPDTDVDCPAVVDGVLLCDVLDLSAQSAPNTDEVLGPPDRLQGYAVADGTLVLDLEVGRGTVAWAAVDDDVVVARQDGRQVTVQLRDTPGGALAWSTPISGEIPTARGLHVAVSDGLVLVTGAVTAVLDLATGAVLGTWSTGDQPGRPLELTTEGGGFTVWPQEGEAVWFDRDGRAGARLPGRPLPAAVDDGSAPSVVVVDDGVLLHAVDVHDGPLWTAPTADTAHLRLGGRLLVEERRTWRVLDLASGDELWRADLGPGSFPGLAPVTDGVRVLVPGYEVATGRQVTARDLATGRERWTAHLPDRAVAITEADGLVVAGGGYEVVFYDAG